MPVVSALSSGFLIELMKLAAQTYRPVRMPGGSSVMVDSRVPVLHDLPEGDKAAHLERVLANMKKQAPRQDKIIRTHHVAVPADVMGDLKQQGFKQSLLHVPLPGEGLLSKSWRKGGLHVHQSGPMYVVHRDDVAPRGFKAPVHFVREGIPAILNRWKQRKEGPVVVSGSPS